MERGNRLSKVPMCNPGPLPSKMLADGMEDSKGIINLDPGSPSDAMDSKILSFEDESLDLIFDAESSVRFSDAYRFLHVPFVSSYGVSSHRPISVQDVAAEGLNAHSFPDDAQESFDPSRVPPRFYLKIPEAVLSIKKELNELMTNPKDGVPPLSLALKTDLIVKKMPWIRSTTVVRKNQVENGRPVCAYAAIL